MICLPGAFHSPEDFLTAGFDEAVRARHLPLDLEFVDIEAQHLTDWRSLERLETEAIAPARARGSSRIWLAGISLGGFLALEFAATHSRSWDGLCLIAPYLGHRGLIAEIATAPRLRDLKPGPLAESDQERRIWRFIQARGTDPRPCFLGFGRDDRYAVAHTLLAGALPAQAVSVVAGGHDWATWRALWELFLDSRFV